jgi:outer membrane protein assembly factor BamA
MVGDRLRYDFHYLIEEENGQDLGFRSRSQFNDLNFVLPEPIMIDELMLEAIQYNFIDISNEVYVHLWRNRTGATGLALEAKYFRNKPNQIATLSSFDPLAGSSGWYLTSKAFLRIDNRDDRHFPHRGVHLNAEARLIYNFSAEYSSTANKPFGLNLDLSFQASSPLSAKTTLGYYVEAGSNFKNSHVPYLYMLGSINENLINNFKPFPGLEFGQVFGTAIAGGGLETRFELFHNHFFITGGRWSYVRDYSDLENELDRYVYGFYAGYRLRTALGPVGINYGHTNLGSEWDFFVGHWF